MNASCRVFVSTDMAQGMSADAWVVGGHMTSLEHTPPVPPAMWVPMEDVLAIIAEHRATLDTFEANLDRSKKAATQSLRVIQDQRTMLDVFEGQVRLNDGT